MTVNVYIPKPLPENLGIDPGSGIVGTIDNSYLTDLNDNPVVLRIDYEGNRYHAVNIITWADRCYHAAGRHLVSYPTIARAWVDPQTMILVGELDMETGVVTLPDTNAQRRVAVWLNGLTPLPDFHVPDDELLTTNQRHVMARHIKEMLATGDPGQAALAHLMEKRYGYSMDKD
jgi:hypothetical protein